MDDDTVRSLCKESGNHSKLTVALLREYCRRNNLSDSGKKADLISKILQKIV